MNRDIESNKEMVTPSEFAVGGVYLPPLFVAALFGLVAAVLSTRQLDRYRLSKYFFYPPVVMLSLAVIYTVLIGHVFIGI